MTTLLEDQKMLQHEIHDEMKQSYIDYAMSVIVSRALPDVRDGLKPVHRRILYGMSELGVTPDKPHKKSARIVGEVMGKYHPHGDSSIYDAMVRLAQPWNIRHALVDGHGNFGSVDGDGAAAMRYTEARMTPLALQMLRDIEKETVDFIPNFDGEEKEPVVLPSRFPNLLVNGSNGIAVGMATSIPPHNLAETIDAAIKIIDEPDCTIDDLTNIVKGPDFPTGAVIMGKNAAKEAYRTGQGKVIVRAVSEIEETSRGRQQIIVTEIPYQVNKARLIEKMAEMVKEKRLEGISEIRDESNRKGMRIVIELKKDANAHIILNRLYKHTQMQETISMIMLAIVNGKPRILNLREILDEYLKHQKEVVTRRTIYDKKKAEARAHILEGYRIALDNIDEIIHIIRNSYNDAKEKLMERFGLSEIQAQAILDMQLRRLQGLEKEKIENEYQDLLKKIAYYNELLADEHKLMGVVKDELTEIKEKWGDKRRTKIKRAESEIDEEDLIEEENVCITLTHLGYIKRVPVDTYKSQKRGGKGVQGVNLKDEDFVEELFVASTHDYVLFFSNKGKVYRLKVHELPIGARTARGSAIVNLVPFADGEKIAAVITCRSFPEDEYLMFATTSGTVKKTSMSAYDRTRRDGIIAIKLRADDELVNVRRVKEGEKVMLVSTDGKAIMFPESDVRPMGRDTSGVRGITLKGDAKMLGMEIANGNGDLFVITEKGYGKRTPVSEYPEHKRGGQGVYTITMTVKKGNLVACRIVGPQHELMIMSNEGVIIRVKVKDISRLGRSTQGVKIMNMADKDSVSTIARMAVRTKKAAKADGGQGALDLASAGAADADEEEPVDLGDGEELSEDLLDGDEE